MVMNTDDKRYSDIENELGPQGCSEYEVRQVKDKYGTLRFYYRLQGDSDLYVDLTSEVRDGRLRAHLPALWRGCVLAKLGRLARHAVPATPQ